MTILANLPHLQMKWNIVNWKWLNLVDHKYCYLREEAVASLARLSKFLPVLVELLKPRFYFLLPVIGKGYEETKSIGWKTNVCSYSRWVFFVNFKFVIGLSAVLESLRGTTKSHFWITFTIVYTYCIWSKSLFNIS